jgi:uncharacterized protein YidB (DUF937 family)
MGLFNQITQLASGFLANNQQSSVLKTLTAIISQPSKSPGGSGLTAIIQGFEKNGLGHLMASWVGTGQNLPASPDQIQKGLGSEVLQQISAKTGIAPDQVSAHLSELLPQLMDKLTPNGKVPDPNALSEMLNLLQSKLKEPAPAN